MARSPVSACSTSKPWSGKALGEGFAERRFVFDEEEMFL